VFRTRTHNGSEWTVFVAGWIIGESPKHDAMKFDTIFLMKEISKKPKTIQSGLKKSQWENEKGNTFEALITSTLLS
jgi:hypothetical protein